MADLRCAKCSSEILAGTNFCRSCGAPVKSGPEPSEKKTALLEDRVARATTRRFEPRETAEASAEVPLGTYNSGARASTPVPPPVPVRFRRSLLIATLVLLILLGGTALVGVMKRLRHSGTRTQVSQQLNYPGAQTIVNVGGESGAVLQMETADRLEKVSAWYEATLKPTKVLKVNVATLIMKNADITVTMAATDSGTSIVIKQSAP